MNVLWSYYNRYLAASCRGPLENCIKGKLDILRIIHYVEFRVISGYSVQKMKGNPAE